MISFFRKLGWLLHRSSKEDELREELQFHLEEEAEEREVGGLPSEAAKRAARRDLGNVTLVQENTRASWGWTLVEQVVQDLRYALRNMAGNPGFTILATVPLALGIGANTAIYSFMDAMLLRSLPVADPGSLVLLNWHSKSPHDGAKPGDDWQPFVMHDMSGTDYDDPKTGLTSGLFPYPAFELFQKSARGGDWRPPEDGGTPNNRQRRSVVRDSIKTPEAVFSCVFAYYPTANLNVMIKGNASLAKGEYVSGDYFRGLAVAPAAGRAIVAGDDRPGAPPVVVVSDAFSQTHFGGPADATGQPILINNVAFTVIGVAPPEFFGVDPGAAPDFYIPLHTNLLVDTGQWGTTAASYLDQNYYWLEAMGRLRPGATLAQAQTTLAPLFHQWVNSTANDKERANLPALLLREGAAGLDHVRRRLSKPLYVLLTMVGLILAIACANTANLLLARASARRREIAVRISIGAGRFRVIRQLLTESALLAIIGGTLGVLFAIWGVRALTLLLASGGQENFTVRAGINWHVLLAALAISLVSGALFGLVPALQSTRTDIMPALKETRGSDQRPRTRLAFLRMNLSHVLVVSQIAISVLLLVTAGLFVRTLSNLHSVQLGFNRENLLLFTINAQQAGHKYPEIATFYADLRKRFTTIPGVRSASLSHASLISASRQHSMTISGNPVRGARVLNTGPAFLSTMQIPLLLGREIDERDRPGSPPVVVISDGFAKTFFGNQDPLGRQITLNGPPSRDMQIVGVAANARYGSLKDDLPPVVYIPYNQGTFPPIMQMTFELRTAGDPLSYVKTVRDIVHGADPRIPVMNVKSQAVEIEQSINQEIAFAKLCGAFAILALVIASAGLYGTMSYTVARRTPEIGIRMALGAQRRGVIWMVLRQVIIMAAAGLAISVPAALGASKLIQSFLYGIKPNDPAALALAVGILIAAALFAGYVPARKASRIDPMIALRHE